MLVYLLLRGVRYEGDRVRGVFATQESAETAMLAEVKEENEHGFRDFRRNEHGVYVCGIDSYRVVDMPVQVETGATTPRPLDLLEFP